jgi:hypothetical protein
MHGNAVALGADGGGKQGVAEVLMLFYGRTSASKHICNVKIVVVPRIEVPKAPNASA